MATLTVYTSSRDGTAITPVSAAGGGDEFDNDGENVLLYVNNASGGDITVSVDTPNTMDGIAVGTKDAVVSAGTEEVLGPWPNAVYGQVSGAITNSIQITYSGVTSLTVCAIKMGSKQAA
jgi:hypothetical protein